MTKNMAADSQGKANPSPVNPGKSPAISADPAQQAAIHHGEGPCAVVAGPGSGKTYVLVERIHYLIDTLKVDPSTILVMTFSRAAALEMRNRFIAREHNTASASGSGDVIFGTFHSVFYRILQESSGERLRIVRQDEKYGYLRHLCEIRPDFSENTDLEKPFPEEPVTQYAQNPNAHFTRKPSFFSEKNTQYFRKSEESDSRFRLPERITAEELQLLVSRYKNGLPCGQPWLPSLIRDYDQYLRSRSCLDFDDMILKCRDLLRARPDIRSLWSSRFQWILVDEFQDVSPSQYEALLLIASPRFNLFIVGDDDQSIYGFRGADPLTMRRFLEDFGLEGPANQKKGSIEGPANQKKGNLGESADQKKKGPEGPANQKKRYPEGPADQKKGNLGGSANQKKKCPEGPEDTKEGGPEKIYLTTNYRCGRSVLRSAASLIRENGNRIAKSYRAGSSEPGCFSCKPFTDREAEYDYIAGELLRMSPEELGQTGVIFRTHAAARRFFPVLQKKEIPFSADGKGPVRKIMTEKSRILRDLASYYRAAAGISESRAARKDLLRIMNCPERFLSGSFILSDYTGREQLLSNAGYERQTIAEFADDLETLNTLSPGYSFRYLMNSVGYRAYANQTYPGKCAILEELTASSALFKNNAAWLTHLEKLLCEEEGGTKEEAEEKAPGFSGGKVRPRQDENTRVHILTMHACKGLEYDTVYIPDLNEGNIPAKQAWTRDQIEEERRLLYVAITRARKTLTITYLEGNPDMPAAPSRFLRPLTAANAFSRV